MEAATTSSTPARSISGASPRVSTRALLTCGVVAGPIFILLAFAQALTRSGFVLADHPLSLLSLGSLGWIQIANFVVCGALFGASAIGIRRSLTGRAAKWGPRLMMVFGASLVAGGVFVADPAFSFPPGTPAGGPEHLSWHGILHAVAPALGFTALVVATFVFARRFASLRQKGWMAASIATGVIVEALSLYPERGRQPRGPVRASVGGDGAGLRLGFCTGGALAEPDRRLIAGWVGRETRSASPYASLRRSTRTRRPLDCVYRVR